MERSLSNITDNYHRIMDSITETVVRCGRRPEEIQLMAVTKTVPAELVNHAISLGVRLLGENRAQELNEKFSQYHRQDTEIHFIGHLQTNKVRQVVGRVSMIQSVDSLRLARMISSESEKAGVTTDLLLEVNIGGEESKGGIAPEQVPELARQIAGLGCVRLRGLMTIPPICDSQQQAERYFSQMQALKVDMQGKNIDNMSMDILSMGMSDDYIPAIRQGATIVRIGSALFGTRRI